MRQAKTLKICANHYGIFFPNLFFCLNNSVNYRISNDLFGVIVFPAIKVQEHAGNEKSCVWHAPDFSDGEVKEEMFCIRFGSVESKNFLFIYLYS